MRTSADGPIVEHPEKQEKARAVKKRAAENSAQQSVETDIVFSRIVDGAPAMADGSHVKPWHELATNVDGACSGHSDISASHGTIGTKKGASNRKLDCSWTVTGGPSVLRYQIWIREMPWIYYW